MSNVIIIYEGKSFLKAALKIFFLGETFFFYKGVSNDCMLYMIIHFGKYNKNNSLEHFISKIKVSIKSKPFTNN